MPGDAVPPQSSFLNESVCRTRARRMLCPPSPPTPLPSPHTRGRQCCMVRMVSSRGPPPPFAVSCAAQPLHLEVPLLFGQPNLASSVVFLFSAVRRRPGLRREEGEREVGEGEREIGKGVLFESSSAACVHRTPKRTRSPPEFLPSAMRDPRKMSWSQLKGWAMCLRKGATFSRCFTIARYT